MDNQTQIITGSILMPDARSEKVKQTRILHKGDKRSDICFQYSNSTYEHILYHADPNCEHEIQAQPSGIKCIKCNGWYCA